MTVELSDEDVERLLDISEKTLKDIGATPTTSRDIILICSIMLQVVCDSSLQTLVDKGLPEEAGRMSIGAIIQQGISIAKLNTEIIPEDEVEAPIPS